MNKVYFHRFVEPLLSERVAPAPQFLDSNNDFWDDRGHECALNEGKVWLEETKWARQLAQWIKRDEKNRKLEIALNQFHQQYSSAFACLLIRDPSSNFKNNKLILSVAAAISSEHFEWCFRTIYLNTSVQGTFENNSDDKNCYTVVVEETF